MDYSVMTTKKLETLKSSFEKQIDEYQKDVRQAVCEIYSLYERLEKINNILDTRIDAEEDVEEKDKNIG